MFGRYIQNLFNLSPLNNNCYQIIKISNFRFISALMLFLVARFIAVVMLEPDVWVQRKTS